MIVHAASLSMKASIGGCGQEVVGVEALVNEMDPLEKLANKLALKVTRYSSKLKKAKTKLQDWRV